MPEGAQPFIKLCSGQLLDEYWQCKECGVSVSSRCNSQTVLQMGPLIPLIVEQKPMIADFKNRWPALFQVNE
ncbi:hypothetical protein AAFF_G00248790, partial [Aldrovandia affinis]